MEYYNELVKQELSEYNRFIERTILYYKNIISEFNNTKFYLGLYISLQIKRIVNSQADKEEVDVLYQTLKYRLDKEGTMWSEMFFKFESWKHFYFDK